ncbi:MAG: sigma-70 family RNA polymerase sigma factor [Isosphaeraceae bacterium]
MDIPSTHAAILGEMGDDGRREEGWAAFRKRYEDVIIHWCLRRGMSRENAEDLTQEVLLKIFERLPTYDPAKGRFRGWLKKVVDNGVT